MTREGEVVLIYYEDHPAIFARIEHIEPDIKKGWYQVTLLMLTIPTHVVTWILRGSYIDGGSFTMGGRSVRLEEVKRMPIKKEPEGVGSHWDKKGPGGSGKVIPFKKSK